jgi:hypothetical protein
VRDGLEERDENIETQLNAEILLRLCIQTSHEGTQAFVEQCREEALCNSRLLKVEQIIDEDEYFFVILHDVLEMGQLILIVLFVPDYLVSDQPVLLDKIAFVNIVGHEGETRHEVVHKGTLQLGKSQNYVSASRTHETLRVVEETSGLD